MFDVYDELLVPAVLPGLRRRPGDAAGRPRAPGRCSRSPPARAWPTRALAATLPPSVAITATDLVPGHGRAGAPRRHRPPDHVGHRRRRRPAVRRRVVRRGGLPVRRHVLPVEAGRVRRSGASPASRWPSELATWDRIEANDFGDVVASSMTELFPDDPPMFLERVPYSYHDPDVIAADLLAGGLTSARVESVEHRSHAATPADRRPRVLCRNAVARPAPGVPVPVGSRPRSTARRGRSRHGSGRPISSAVRPRWWRPRPRR